jgi:hypothetical protein
MPLSFGMVLGGLLGLAVPFHTAPGVDEFHTKPEFHVNDSGMGSEFAGNALTLAMFFSREYHLRREKIVTGAQKCFNVTLPETMIYSKRWFLYFAYVPSSCFPHITLCAADS